MLNCTHLGMMKCVALLSIVLVVAQTATTASLSIKCRPGGIIVDVPGSSPICQPCPAGQYCAGGDSRQSSGLCSAGYYCPEGSSSPTPANKLCPTGHYCPVGTAAPLACPPGTYSSILGLTSIPECTDCPAGSYCDQQGAAQPSGPCSAGYVCPPGSTRPTATICPVGHYCPTGSAAVVPCPAGTFGLALGSASASDCRPCPAGSYCPAPGLAVPTGHCDAGYFCPAGSVTPNPIHGICPSGHFCPQGSPAPTACAKGTYSKLVGASSSQECKVCPAGMLCDSEGLVQPTGDCPSGHYCPEGSTLGTVCPTNHYCPMGSSAPTLCPVGTHTSSNGSTTASDCVPQIAAQ